MDDQLVGYILGSLDDDEHAAVEAYVKSDPESAGKLDRLRRALAPLEADRADPSPPAGLVERTLQKLGIADERPLPAAPYVAGSTQTRAFWTRADFLVAASLLIIFFGLAFTSIWRLRQQEAILGCKNNLHDFWVALKQHHDLAENGKAFPDVNAVKPPANVAGVVVPMLIDKGFLKKDANVRCPAKGKPTPCSVDLKDILKMSKKEIENMAPQFMPCYAYTLGYRGDKYHGPKSTDDVPNTLTPIMADRPPFLVSDRGNSPNHHGMGQNVLFRDGSVRFCNSRNIGLPNDDIYLNSDNKIAAGNGPMDVVLGSSAAKP